MPKISDAQFEKVVIRLYRGDKDRLAAAYPTVGYNVVIRTLVSKHLRKLDERTFRNLPPSTEPGELEIPAGADLRDKPTVT